MNRCHFIGRFTRDPELKQLDSSCVTNFSLAISRRYKKSNGDWTEETAFADFEAWDKGAELISNKFKKGDLILVHCSLKQDRWSDSEGNNRSRLKFRVNQFEWVPSNKNHVQTGNVEDQEDVPQGNEADEEAIPF